jgi:UDP-N-acetyl-D-galactosamine dehydrogenase
MIVDFKTLRAGERAVAVVGLGYVGLPLAVALAPHFRIIGFDINEGRIEELKQGRDRTREVDDAKLAAARLEYTSDPARIAEAGVVIVAVPTPIDTSRNPDRGPVLSASRNVGRHMAAGSVVVYESTVYPGLTEEECVPLLEEESGMTCGADFTVGYSPERINPGDKVHTLETIVKVVAGQDEATGALLEKLYGTVVSAGIHRASTIRVAEAAKVIENTQRDLNIALMNELSLIFDRMGIDTREVLAAAGTKWNFLPFSPGLVGGHCIGVDPYYLTFKAQQVDYHPEVILAGRRINDGMGSHVAQRCIKMMINNGGCTEESRVAVLGLTFKENVPDLRNTRVIDVIRELEEYTCKVLVHDPLVDPQEAREEYGLELVGEDALTQLDAVILAVPHAEFVGYTPETIRAMCRNPEGAILVDVRGTCDKAAFEAAGVAYWRL